MELTEDQKQEVASWAAEGCSLSDIQKRLSERLGVSMTYMDVRFLVIELGLDLKERSSGPAAPPPDVTADAVPDQAAGGGVSVEVDRVVKAGSVVSGSVRFSDGKSGTWSLDHFGRLALDVGDPGYAPSQADVAEFQQALREAMTGGGL